MNTPESSLGGQNTSRAKSIGSRLAYLLMFVVSLGCFGVFLAVLRHGDIPWSEGTPVVDLSKIPQEEQWKFSPVGRRDRLDELGSRERALAASYAWIDREKQIVRLPIDRAMELTVKELNVGRKPRTADLAS